MSQDLEAHRKSEKVRLERLNSRLEAYIKVVRDQKVRNPEPGKGVRSLIVNEEYESQLTLLRREKQTLKYELDKAEKSSVNREDEVKRIRKQLDDALISKLYADKKLELVQDELRLLQETNKEISLLLNQMRMESVDAKSQITDLEHKLKDSRQKLEVYLLDRNKLSMSKTSLELEIVTYERLLKAEEERIKIKNEKRENTESATTADETEENWKKTQATKVSYEREQVTEYSNTVTEAIASQSVAVDSKVAEAYSGGYADDGEDESATAAIETEENWKNTQITNVSNEREQVTEYSNTVTEAIAFQSVAVDSKVAEAYSGGYADDGEDGLIAGLGVTSYPVAEDAIQQYESADAEDYSIVVETSGKADVSVETRESSSSSESGSEAEKEEREEQHERTHKKSRFGGLFSKKK